MPLTNKFWALPTDLAQSILACMAANCPKPDGQTPPQAAWSGSGEEKDTRYTVQGGVAVLSVNGPITKTTRYYDGKPYTCGQNDIAAALAIALADTSVKAILLDIDSPGGIVPGTKELADAIASAAKIKPMAAYANGLMTSAAMWLGAATGRVYSPVTSLVGSVGIIMVHADYSKLNERWGVAYSYITGGKLKDAGNDANPLSDEARALFQKQVTDLHEIFKADVIRGLGITAPAAAWAEGQTLLAGEAKNLGLVTDIVRDLPSAITTLRMEATMDYATFAANHPDLLAEITAKAKTEAEAACQAAATAKAPQAGFTQDDVLALVTAVAGEETKGTVGNLMASGFSLAQVQTLATLGMLGAPAAPSANRGGEQSSPGSASRAASAASSGTDTKAAILAALQNVTPGAVEGAVPPAAAQKSPLVADAEKRAAKS